MIQQVPRVQTPDYFSEFQRIKFGRSVLRQFTYHPMSTIWRSDTGALLLSYKHFGFLDADIDTPDLEVLLDHLPVQTYLIVNQDETNLIWQSKLENYFEQVEQVDRWAFSSQNLDLDILNKTQNTAPDGYILKKMEQSDYKYLEEVMKAPAILIYGSAEELFRQAVCYGIIDEHQAVLVALCIGFPLLEDEWEIEIRTKDDEKYRRKGFGSIVARALMIHALENNKIPVWDAANLISRDMALKLGFTDPVHYRVYICSKE